MADRNLEQFLFAEFFHLKGQIKSEANINFNIINNYRWGIQNLYRYFYAVLIIFICFLCQANARQLILYKEKSNQYTLKLDITNLKVNLHATINTKNTWLKSDQCKVCSLNTNQNEAENTKGNQDSTGSKQAFLCQDTCFNNDEQYGVKCLKSHCSPINSIQNQGFIISGQKVSIDVMDQIDKQKYKLKPILVNKISKTKNINLHYEGEYAVFGEGSVFQNTYLLKNNAQNITIYDDESQIKNFIIQNDKTVLQLGSTSEEESSTNLQFMEFGVSQIKISDVLNINNDKPQMVSIQIPVNPIIKGQFSLDTDKFSLPSKQFHKFIEQIIKSFFTFQDQTNICQFSEGSITCSEQISLEKIQYTQLQLVINGVSLKFPLKILIQNCKKNACQFLVAKSQHLIIGDFILNAFVISNHNSDHSSLQNLSFHRLDNQWGKMYKSNQRYTKQKFSVIWWIISTIYYIFYYFFLIVFYLAIFSIVVNCFIHWRNVLGWVISICNKIQRQYKVKQQPLGQDQDKDTSKLIKNWSRSTLPSMEQQESISEV